MKVAVIALVFAISVLNNVFASSSISKCRAELSKAAIETPSLQLVVKMVFTFTEKDIEENPDVLTQIQNIPEDITVVSREHFLENTITVEQVLKGPALSLREEFSKLKPFLRDTRILAEGLVSHRVHARDLQELASVLLRELKGEDRKIKKVISSPVLKEDLVLVPLSVALPIFAQEEMEAYYLSELGDDPDQVQFFISNVLSKISVLKTVGMYSRSTSTRQVPIWCMVFESVFQKYFPHDTLIPDQIENVSVLSRLSQNYELFQRGQKRLKELLAESMTVVSFPKIMEFKEPETTNSMDVDRLQSLSELLAKSREGQLGLIAFFMKTNAAAAVIQNMIRVSRHFKVGKTALTAWIDEIVSSLENVASVIENEDDRLFFKTLIAEVKDEFIGESNLSTFKVLDKLGALSRGDYRHFSKMNAFIPFLKIMVYIRDEIRRSGAIGSLAEELHSSGSLKKMITLNRKLILPYKQVKPQHFDNYLDSKEVIENASQHCLGSASFKLKN